MLAYVASAIEVDRLELLKTNGHYIIGPHALNRRLGWKKYHHEKRLTRILDSGHGRELAQVGNKNFFNKVSQEMVCRLKKFKACAAEKKGEKPTNVSTCMGHAGK